MWFADIGLALAWAVLLGVLVVIGAAVLGSRMGYPALTAVLVAPARIPMLVGALAAAVLFVAQAGVVDIVEDLAGPGPFDQTVWSWFIAHRTPALTAVMTAVSALGGTVGMAVLAAAGSGVLWWLRRRAHAAVVIAAALGAQLLVGGFKNLYGRARPPAAEQVTVETTFALPSGHSVGSMVVLGVLAAVVVLLVRRRVVQVAAAVAATVGIVAVGMSRLYLGHVD